MTTVIAESLAGKRIAVTGSTGFVGTALVERLLRGVPDCELVLLIRPGRRTDAAQRARKEIFRNDAFDRLREQWGDDFDATIDRRVTAIAGDVSTDGLGLEPDGRRIFSTCDTVIHSAATVSFDSPLDLAVEINLLGPTRITALCHAARRHGPTWSPCRPATWRATGAATLPKSSSARARSTSGLDWRKEVAAARRPEGRQRGTQPRTRSPRDGSGPRRAPRSAPRAHPPSPPRPNSSGSDG
jgi:alcohol-forming fatty acyl-CoA reductase